MSTKTLLIGEIFEKGQRAVGHVPRDINQGSINEELGTRWIANKKIIEEERRLMTEAKEMGMERTLCNQQSLADKEIKKRKRRRRRRKGCLEELQKEINAIVNESRSRRKREKKGFGMVAISCSVHCVFHLLHLLLLLRRVYVCRLFVLNIVYLFGEPSWKLLPEEYSTGRCATLLIPF